MISQSDLHDITDRIGAQIEDIRTYFGEYTDTCAGAAGDISESLCKAKDDIIAGADLDAITQLIPPLDNLAVAMDFDNALKTKYGNFIRTLNSHLRGTSVSNYSGYSIFAIDNSGTRYCSEFCRLLTLFGISLAGDAHGFYDQNEDLGRFTQTAQFTGTWAASGFAWSSPVDTYGIQPSCNVALIPVSDSGGGGETVDIAVSATDIDDTLVYYEVQITSPFLLTTPLTGDASDELLKSVENVKILTASADIDLIFDVHLHPIRGIAL